MNGECFLNRPFLLQVKGPNASQLVQDCMKDLYIMKVPSIQLEHGV